MPSAWVFLSEAKQKAWQKKIDLDNDSLKIALVLSTSNIASDMSPSGYADLTHEVAAGNGYSTGGEAVPSQTLTGGSFVNFEIDDVVFTPSGGNIVARTAVLYDDSATDKDILAFALLDPANIDVTIVNGAPLTLQGGSVFFEF